MGSRAFLGILLVLTAGGCAATRPPAQRLAGPLPTSPAELSAARWLDSARALLGDLLILPPHEGRNDFLPSVGPEGRREAIAALRQLEENRKSVIEAGLDPREVRSLRQGTTLIARAKAIWTDDRLPPEVLDRVWMRARRSLLTTEPRRRSRLAERLSQVAAEAGAAVAVTSERERTWALDRLAAHEEELEQLELSGPFVDAYREALEDAPTARPKPLGPALALAVGSTQAPPLRPLLARARRALNNARRQIYARSLDVTSDGPADVDARVETALPEARRGAPPPESDAELDLLLAELGAWVARSTGWPASRVPVEGRFVPGGVELRVRTTTAAEQGWRRTRLPTGAMLGGREGFLAWLTPTVVRRLAQLHRPSDAPFPVDEVSLRAITSLALDRMVRDPSAPAKARLLVAAFVVERRGRATAELVLRVRGRNEAVELLTTSAWYDQASAEAVVDAARAEPGVYAAPFFAESLLGGRPACTAWPATLCRDEG